VSGKGNSLSVFFPCHNEQGNIASLVTKTIELLAGIGNDYEIIIVNDGSTDDTARIADRLAQQNKYVKVVHHETNLGYGAALQSGFHAATKEWVFYTDGDGQFDITELADILHLADKYDIISCYRLNRRDSFVRKLNTWSWCRLVGWMFDLKLRDIDCAFKLYRRTIFDKIDMKSQGALIDTEILARAKRAGFSITQHGVRHYPRTTGQQSGASLKVILRAFKELFKLRRQIKTGFM